MAGIEIAELKDALSFAEYQLAKVHSEKDEIQKNQTQNIFQLKDAQDKLRLAVSDKESLQREMDRQQTKVDMVEKNQEIVSVTQINLKLRCQTKQESVSAYFNERLRSARMKFKS